MIYIIPKGKHKSSYSLVFTFKNAFRHIVEFNQSCIYTNLNPNNQLDINKLYGVSESVDPHYNSARFGWRAKGTDKIEIFAYTYIKGERMSKFITEVFIYAPHLFSLLLLDNLYHFECNGVSVTMPREKGWFKYKLWPFFGGDSVPDHDIIISVT